MQGFILDGTKKQVKGQAFCHYNALMDKHLQSYFNKDRLQILKSNKIINDQGIIIKNKIFYKAEKILAQKEKINQLQRILQRKPNEDLKCPYERLPLIEKNKNLVKELSSQVHSYKIQQNKTQSFQDLNYKTFNYKSQPKLNNTQSMFANKNNTPSFIKRQLKN